MNNQVIEYWQKQVEQLRKVKLSYHCTQRKCLNSQAIYYDLEFTSFDGTKIYAKYIRPNHQEKVPVVFDFHRYQASSQGWFHITRYVALNYAVVAMDCRGQGGQSLDTLNSVGTTVCGHIMKGIDGQVEDLYYHKVYLDALLLSWIVEELEGIDSERMISFGRDQGAAIAFVLAALNPRIKKCSMLYPMLVDIRELIERNEESGMSEDIRYYMRWFDPLNNRKEEILNKLDYIDMINFTSLVKADVLLASAMLDTKTPAWSHKKLFEQLNCQKKLLQFVKHEHELINAFEDENLKFIL
ncbi:MAG: acetylxylan esterase [Coprobacillus sp.]